MSESDFDLAALDATDEAQLAIRDPRSANPTTWVWTFYGPGHPKTVELANRVAREQLREGREKEVAQANGKKWRGEDRSVDEVRERNLSRIVERVKSWTPVRMGGEELQFSPEATKKLLLDPNKGWLLAQVSEFLLDNESFMRPSATI